MATQLMDFEYEEIFDFLDDLRRHGGINMLGTVELIADRFDLDTQDARQALVAWITTFNAIEDTKQRAQRAYEKSALREVS